MNAAVLRVLKAFGRFCLEFLIGDTPELFIAAVLLVGLSFALRDYRVIAIIVLPVVASVLLVGSAFRGRAKSLQMERESASVEPIVERRS